MNIVNQSLPEYVWIFHDEDSNSPQLTSFWKNPDGAEEYVQIKKVREYVKEEQERELDLVSDFERIITEQQKEINRLKEGNFTEEEFQNLCHNKTVEDGYCIFVRGCNEYQKKLFGRCQNEDQEKREKALKSLQEINSLNSQFKLLGELK